MRGSSLSRRTLLRTSAAAVAGGVAAVCSDMAGMLSSAIAAGSPPELESALPAVQWRRRGSATLRVLLFKVYDATLWAASEKANPLDEALPFALEITYSIGVKGDDIIDTSLQEITRLRNPSAETLKKWAIAMKSVLPSVSAGDRLLGLSIPNKGARFYLNSKLLGEVNDVAFTEAFFAIWLDANTKKPEMRRALLAQFTMR
jgi:Chalcone isomerase-like